MRVLLFLALKNNPPKQKETKFNFLFPIDLLNGIWRLSNISVAEVIAVEGEDLQYWSSLLLNYYRTGPSALARVCGLSTPRQTWVCW